MKKILNNNFLPWFAGFFEGEGCFYISKKNIAHLSIQQSDKYNGESVIKILKEKLGGNINHAGKYQSWTWQLGNSKIIVQIIESILPYTRFKTQELKNKIKQVKDYFSRNCKICGRTFWADSTHKITCGNLQCRKRHHSEWQKQYYRKNSEHQERHRKHALKSYHKHKDNSKKFLTNSTISDRL